MGVMLEPGARAPSFTLPDHCGDPVSLEDFSGRWLVLWWYVRADTPG
jgi:peroxiredoxin Q/BCP